MAGLMLTNHIQQNMVMKGLNMVSSDSPHILPAAKRFLIMLIHNIIHIILLTEIWVIHKNYCKLCPSKMTKPYSAGTDFSRQNLKSVDVRF